MPKYYVMLDIGQEELKIPHMDEVKLRLFGSIVAKKDTPEYRCLSQAQKGAEYKILFEELSPGVMSQLDKIGLPRSRYWYALISDISVVAHLIIQNSDYFHFVFQLARPASEAAYLGDKPIPSIGIQTNQFSFFSTEKSDDEGCNSPYTAQVRPQAGRPTINQKKGNFFTENILDWRDAQFERKKAAQHETDLRAAHKYQDNEDKSGQGSIALLKKSNAGPKGKKKGTE